MKSIDAFDQKAKFVIGLLTALINTPDPTTLKTNLQKTSFIIHLPSNFKTIDDISFISGILDAMNIPFDFKNNFALIVIPVNFKEIINRNNFIESVLQCMYFDATDNGVLN